jgi:diketogulonate reductase-like aldo/keto reductase
MNIPTKTLYTGAKIPAIGLGTFGSDKYSASEVAAMIPVAADLGYRHFDCAAVYGNEADIGQALQGVVSGGVPRSELWVTSKLWNDKHDPKDVSAAFEKSLRDLQLDYLDLYLIHWPFPNFHAPKVDVSSRDPHAKPYIHENFMATWRELEKLVRRGLVRHIGTSNVTIPKLKLILRDAQIKPAANEMELHPHFQQPELFEYVVSEGIQPIGYSPFGSPSRPERDRTPDDTVDLEDPVLIEIGEAHGLSPASVALAWAMQRGQIPIPFSVKSSQLQSNLAAAGGSLLSEEEMAAISRIDRGCRLIKGQVFLWEGAESWEALWDVDGKIAQ